MTIIQHYSQLFHRKYVYPTDENKNEEFFVKMNKHFAELREIDKTRAKKVKEIEEYLETIDFNFGDVDYQEEIDYEETLREVKVDDEEITLDEDFFDNYEYDETQLAKMEEKMEKKDWYVTYFQIDEGYMELEIDEEFDKSKLKWNGESMKYGDDWVGDTSGTKPNSDVETECVYDNEDDDVYTSFSHCWY
jgi:hypothetical protein